MRARAIAVTSACVCFQTYLMINELEFERFVSERKILVFPSTFHVCTDFSVLTIYSLSFI
jgi:hypothetical protein